MTAATGTVLKSITRMSILEIAREAGIECIEGQLKPELLFEAEELAKEKGLAIILSSHIMGPLLSLCDTLYVLKEGSMLLSGTLEQIVEEYITAYEIRGVGLDKSKTLAQYEYSEDGTKALVKIDKASVNDILKKLLEEGIEIASVSPVINFQEML